jgi:hypothetical protein
VHGHDMNLNNDVLHLLVAGLKGLYRGLGSNLTSSAPISAIYTLTYEAVKAGLLRHIPEVWLFPAF